jgi:hypothetical protein
MVKKNKEITGRQPVGGRGERRIPRFRWMGEVKLDLRNIDMTRGTRRVLDKLAIVLSHFRFNALWLAPLYW